MCHCTVVVGVVTKIQRTLLEKVEEKLRAPVLRDLPRGPRLLLPITGNMYLEWQN